MRQTELNLNEEDRLVIEEIRSKGLHQAREVNRAHALSCLDRGIPEAQIMAVLGIGRTAVWRPRGAYLQGGAELAVFDVERSGRGSWRVAAGQRSDLGSAYLSRDGRHLFVSRWH